MKRKILAEDLGKLTGVSADLYVDGKKIGRVKLSFEKE